MAQENSTVRDQVTAIIAEHLDVEMREVTREAALIDDLGADSLDIVELVMILEEQFGIEIPDEDAEDIKTVDDVVTYIEKKFAEKESTFID